MELYMFNIGEAAGASGVTAKMIRHYEEIGLISTVKRAESGYRKYSRNEIHELRFIRQARNLGFSTRQIETLLKLWRDQHRSSAKVRQLALDHVRELEQKIDELRAMKLALRHLAKNCHGDDRPDCPILEGLASLKVASNDAPCHGNKATTRRIMARASRRGGQN